MYSITITYKRILLCIILLLFVSIYEGKGNSLAPQPLLPYLLSTVGRAAKVPSGGHSVLVAMLRLLSVIVGGCDIAARQVRGVLCGVVL